MGQYWTRCLWKRYAIFNWFLEGLHRLISNNYKVTKCQACEDAVKEYREKLDTVYRYLSECYIITGNKTDMISKPDFESAYITWCQFNNFTNVNKQNIKDRMEANGCPVGKANVGGRRGIMVYRNLKQKR